MISQPSDYDDEDDNDGTGGQYGDEDFVDTDQIISDRNADLSS